MALVPCRDNSVKLSLKEDEDCSENLLHPWSEKEKSARASASCWLNTFHRKSGCPPRIPALIFLAVLQDQG